MGINQMNESIEYKVDRSNWKKGEWDNEPDRVDFIHSGFSCFILRNAMGNWCGYVGVPSNHTSYEKSYDDVDVDVHGGLTYANKCQGAICHIPSERMPDDVWWLGFDTSHYGDLSPSKLMHDFGNEYRNMNYTINETRKLAEQLSEIR